MKTRISMLGISVIIILLDQFTKYLVDLHRPYIMVIPRLFNITYVENRGAAFGIFQGRLLLLSLVSLVAVGVLIYLILKESAQRKGLLLALSLILGGTVGNFIDRAFRRYVIDFLDFHISTHHWPSFNIADSAISVGVTLLILVTLWEEFTRMKRQKAASSQTSSQDPS